MRAFFGSCLQFVVIVIGQFFHVMIELFLLRVALRLQTVDLQPKLPDQLF